MNSPKIRLLAVAAVGCAGALAAVAGVSAETPTTPDTGTWVTNGSVHAIARADGRTYIGGNFTRVGRRTGHGVQLAPGTGVPSPGVGQFPEVSGGPIRAVVSDGVEGWYIGGDFTSVGGLSRSRLAHVVPNGSGGMTVDPSWNPGADGAVRALALGTSPGETAMSARGVLYVGGSFQKVRDTALPYAAALNAATGEPIPAWNPAPDNAVHAIGVQNVTFAVTPAGGAATPTTMSVVFLGGEFLSFANNGGNPDRLGAVWGAGAVSRTAASTEGKPIAWNPNSAGTVRAVAPAPAVPVAGPPPKQFIAVYVGGTAPAMPALRAVRFGIQTQGATSGNVDASADYGGWTPAVACADCTPTVRALALSPATQSLYLGGDFTAIGANVPRKRIASVATITGATVGGGGSPATPRAWNPDAEDGRVRALALAGNTLYAGGDFTRFRTGADREGLAAFAADPAAADPAPTGWNPRATGGLSGASNGVVNAVAATPSAVYAGGSFNAIGASVAEGLAAFDSAGNLDESWKPNPDGPVHALGAANGRLYIGGDFANLSGAARAGLAATSLADGSLDSSWAPAVASASGSPTEALALSATDQAVYVGGAFDRLGGSDRTNAGAVDPASGATLGWNPAPNGNVYSLLATCGTVYAGGGFTSAGGAARNRIAALDPASGTASDWNPDANSTVYALAQDEGTLYVGGRFSAIGGEVRTKLAALSLKTGTATGWNPTVSGDSVRAVAAPAGEPVTYAGGAFDAIRGAARANVAAVDRATGEATAWNPGTDDANPATSDVVRALLAEGPALWVGGDFRQIGAPPLMQEGFAAFDPGLATGSNVTTCGTPEPEPVPEPPPAEPVPEPTVERPHLPIAVDSVAPILAELSAKPRRFRVRRPRTPSTAAAERRRTPTRTVFRYTLSENARVRFTFQIAEPCRNKPTRKRCVRWVSIGRREYQSVAGLSKRRFAGRLGRRYLRPGRYRALVRAFDPAGNRSPRHKVRFTVVRR